MLLSSYACPSLCVSSQHVLPSRSRQGSSSIAFHETGTRRPWHRMRWAAHRMGVPWPCVRSEVATSRYVASKSQCTKKQKVETNRDIKFFSPSSLSSESISALRDLLGLLLRELVAFGCLAEEHDFALLKVPAGVLVDQHEGEVVAGAELFVHLAEGGGQVEAAEEQADGYCFAAGWGSVHDLVWLADGLREYRI